MEHNPWSLDPHLSAACQVLGMSVFEGAALTQSQERTKDDRGYHFRILDRP